MDVFASDKGGRLGGEDGEMTSFGLTEVVPPTIVVVLIASDNKQEKQIEL